MQSAIKFGTTTQKQFNAPTRTDEWIYAVQLNDGRIAIGQSTNAGKAIAWLNGGQNKLVPKAFQVYRILGVKEVSESRNLPSVVAKFCEEYGEDSVVCL